MANWDKLNINLKFWWQIDDEKSEQYKTTLLNAEKDPEKHWFTVDIRDQGLRPIFVREGQKIHICAMVESDNYMRYMFFGRDGTQAKNAVREGQDYDFDMENSRFNEKNSSSNSGQFPFILYYK